ncbi:MAG: mucoidy inhibitor MuiA family protein, partial [Bacteroidota bacterium]
VFLTGAQVRHKGQVNLKKGENTIVLSGLTANMDVNSIQIVGNSDYVILSVKHRLNYESKKSNTRVQSIQDSIKLLGFQNAERASLRSVYSEEKSFLQANRAIKGDNTLLLKEDLSEMADFYRTRMKEIEYKLLELSQNDREANEKISKLQQQLSQLNSQNGINPGEIEFVLQAEEDKKSDVEISYIANGAGWAPYYDIRSEEIESDVEFTYRAKVYNSTGVDWKRVNITLSTGNPSAGAQAPTVQPWYITLYQPQAYEKRKREEANSYFGKDNQAPASAMLFDDKISESSKLQNGFKTSASYTEVVNSSVSVEFRISVKYDIASDNQPVEMVMQKQKLKANYKYVCAPKFDLSAYLQAEITDWMQYSLLPGE